MDVSSIKRKLLIKYPSFGSIVANAKFIEEPGVEIAATDGKNIYYNPICIDNYNTEEQIFIFAHEVCHIAFNHIFRSEGKDEELWNIATDSVINALLRSDGLPIIEGALDFPEAILYDAETLYNRLLELKQQQEENNEQQKNGETSQSQTNQSGSSEEIKNQNGTEKTENQENNEQQSDKEPESSDNKNQEKEDSNDKDNKEQKDDSSKDEKESDTKDDKNSDEEKSDNEENKKQQSDKEPESSDNKNQDKEDSNDKDNKEQKDDSSKDDKESSGSIKEDKKEESESKEEPSKDVGHDTHIMWKKAIEERHREEAKQEESKSEEDSSSNEQEEVVDEQDIFNENQREREEMLEELRKALASKSHGYDREDVDSGFRKVGEIGTAKPIIDWRYILRESMRYNLDWSYQNATFEDGILTPHLEKQPISETEIVLDTSASVDEDLLRNFLRECKNIIQSSKVKVGCFDTKFYGFTEIRNVKDIDELQFQGGGDTDFNVAVNAFSRRVENKIIFTDGKATVPEMPLDVIWIVYGSKRIDPPGGKVIYITDEQLEKLTNLETGSKKKSL